MFTEVHVLLDGQILIQMINSDEDPNELHRLFFFFNIRLLAMLFTRINFRFIPMIAYFQADSLAKEALQTLFRSKLIKLLVGLQNKNVVDSEP